MILCLGGVYTSNFIDLVPINACILALSNILIKPEEPPHDPPALQHLLHQNTTFKYSFRSARKDMIFTNHYNNHRAFNPYRSSIHEKSATNIQKSFSIAIPCWTHRFFRGLFLSALGYSTRTHKGKVKGIHFNYPSALLSAPN